MRSISHVSVLAILLATAALVACSEDGPSEPSNPDLPELPAWDRRREFAATLTFAGRERTLIGHLPLSYDHEHRVPLLLAYHGSGMSAELMREATGLDWVANDFGFAVIYPDASDGFFPVPCPGCENDGRDGYEEIDFAREIVRWASGKYAVSPEDVYATGFSMGGYFVNYLGCASDSPVRGIAPVAAGAREDFDGFCSAPQPSVIIIHALQDLVAPIDGAPGSLSISDLAELWRTHDDCGPEPLEWEYPDGAEGTPTVHARLWAGCAGSAAVRLDVIDGAGHWWPTAADNANGIDAGRTIAGFFFPLLP